LTCREGRTTAIAVEGCSIDWIVSQIDGEIDGEIDGQIHRLSADKTMDSCSAASTALISHLASPTSMLSDYLQPRNVRTSWPSVCNPLGALSIWLWDWAFNSTPVKMYAR